MKSRREIAGSMIGWATSSPAANSRPTADGGKIVHTGWRVRTAAIIASASISMRGLMVIP